MGAVVGNLIKDGLAFGGENFDTMYVANLGRQTITRAKVGLRGQPLVNLR